MTEPTSALQIVWAPNGGASAAHGWSLDRAVDTTSLVGTGDVVRLGGGVKVICRDGTIEAAWRDSGWQAGLQEDALAVIVTADELRVSVPATWRAHAYLGWRDGHLLISSDLRTIAAAMPTANPAPEGIAAFLSGSRHTSGISPSLYRGIWEVQAGHTVTVDRDRSMLCHRTWTPEQDDEFDAQPLKVVTQRVSDHLDALAERILARHDRVACLFSGGLDSTLIAATLVRRAPKRVVLFNVGSGLGTAAEASLRTRFLHDSGAISYPVDLPPDASLVRSLRATNAVAALPIGSLFAHAFEEIIAAAQAHGCDAILTGDGGDEVFAEREEILVDLLARRSRTLPAAAGHFALRNGERATRTLWRAGRRLRALRDGAAHAHHPGLGNVLLGDGLAELARDTRAAAAAQERDLWSTGWTYSGIGSYRRAAAVPEWEPISAHSPTFHVASPLADMELVRDALALRRDTVIAGVVRGQPKWVLRQAALNWLTPDVALHPKIGSADSHILARLRTHELHDLLQLLSSTTARTLGLALPAAVEDRNAPLWRGDAWVKTAALVGWFDQTSPQPRARPAIAVTTGTPPELMPVPAAGSGTPASPTRWRVGAVAALNIAAQLASPFRIERRSVGPSPVSSSATDDELAWTITDLARRACALPVVSASSHVMTRALAWYLRLTGERPIVVRGALHNQMTNHYWIEVQGSVVDVSGIETPLVPGKEPSVGP